MIEELGSHIVHLNAKVDRERIKALKAVEDKEKSILLQKVAKLLDIK